MARKRPADDDIDWVALLDDDLDDVLTEVANKASSSSKATTSSLVAGKSSSSQPSGIEMITIGGDEEYDKDDDEQLAKAIALSLQDNSRSGSSAGSMPDVMFLPGCSSKSLLSLLSALHFCVSPQHLFLFFFRFNRYLFPFHFRLSNLFVLAQNVRRWSGGHFRRSKRSGA